MPKATLEFDLPEEKPEYDLMNNASNFFGALFDLGEYLRSRLKYTELSEAEVEIYENMREEFYSILENNLVTLENFQ